MMPSKKSDETPHFVRDHFRQQATSFDRLYRDDASWFQRVVRPGLFARQQAAIDLVRSYDRPRVLDVGCGSGRVAELLMEAGAESYVGVDFSEPMLDLSRERLARFGDAITLLRGDFVELPLDGQFDVVLALGLFDYIAEPHRFTVKMREHCRGSVIASFPRWNWYKGPIRHIRYEIINNCPIFDYTERELEFLFKASGFATVSIDAQRSGFVVRAESPR